MSNKIKVTWAGFESTAIRTEPNGEKIEVKPGEVFEMDRSHAESLNKTYKQLLLGEHEVAVKKPEVKNDGGEEDLSKLRKPELIGKLGGLGLKEGEDFKKSATNKELLELLEKTISDQATERKNILARLAELEVKTATFDDGEVAIEKVEHIEDLRDILEQAEADADADTDEGSSTDEGSAEGEGSVEDPSAPAPGEGEGDKTGEGEAGSDGEGEGSEENGEAAAQI